MTDVMLCAIDATPSSAQVLRAAVRFVACNWLLAPATTASS